MKPTLKLLFLIRDLHPGGAQYQLSVLAQGLRQRGHQVGIAVFYPGGSLEPALRAADVSIYSLDKRGRWDLLGFFWRLQRCLRQTGARCIHSYLPVANLLSVLIGGWRGDLTVVWGVRSSAIQHKHLSPSARLCQWLEQRLARFADLIICNSTTGAQDVIARGFPEARVRVLHNGIDTDTFQPDPAAGDHQRQRWGIPPQGLLIGLVGRLDPLKAHPSFLQMAAQLHQYHPTLQFVCIGDGPEAYRQSLIKQADKLGLSGVVHWVGHCEAMHAAYNALDMLVSTSISEGFANVIAEAMACGVPCVVTPVGDAQHIIADAGIVVPSTQVQALLKGCQQLLALSPSQRHTLGRRARQRITQEFPRHLLVQRTERLLSCLDQHQPLPTTIITRPPARHS